MEYLKKIWHWLNQSNEPIHPQMRYQPIIFYKLIALIIIISLAYAGMKYLFETLTQ